jgi:signal peptidase I
MKLLSIIMKANLKNAWNFFWHSDSVWSWIANIIVAFLLIRFIIYPILGLVLGTGFPIVAVISESMEHGTSPVCIEKENGLCIKYSDQYYQLCGDQFTDFKNSFNNYWEICGEWYENNQISKEQFQNFPFKSGFDKGDVIILWRANSKNLETGDILVFQGKAPQPIIHRVVKIWQEDEKYFYQTKGDHNPDSYPEILEDKIGEERVLGKGLFKIPYLGWIKILFVDAVRPLGIVIER